ncbi:hypothetical protein [Niabella sp.]|uniref:hypothetical protein n=1 Tax=Niabella sp. TaxID=1962976 RepID=UPI00263404B6|nr:hypothetical protein [Niabella sp.]
MENSTEENGKTQAELLHERTKLGKLPVIEIAGHPFYVDVRMETFRPHDDFTALGISFSIFNRFEMSFCPVRIAYDPRKHVALNIDYEKLSEIPKDWIMVEIPHPKTLDPYGYARENGLNIEQTLRSYPLRENVKAKIVPWEDTGILFYIEENKKKMERGQRREQKKLLNQDMGKRKSRGVSR